MAAAAAAKHLSVELVAPEQPFQATTATESMFAGSTRDRTEQSSQDGSAKHRTLTQGTHQQITEHKPAKTTAPERRIKPEISNCSITLHVLYCYITLLYGTLSCVVWQLHWQAVSQLHTVWQTAALAHSWSIYCTFLTHQHLCMPGFLLPYLSWPQALLLSGATERTKASPECWPG